MSTTTAVNTVPRSVVVGNGSVSEQANLVGPSMLGWVYRSLSGTAWYRLIPSSQVSLEWRHCIRTYVPPSDSQLLAASRDWYQPFPDEPRLVILYRTNGPVRSFAECIADADATVRLRSAVAAVRALSKWWGAVSPPLLPLPADIVVAEDGTVRVLWIPLSHLPDARTAFAAPERILYLPPELLRSAANVTWDATTWQAVDRYAIGVSLLGCYCELPSVQRPELAMFRAGTGSLFQRLSPRTDLPPWLERFTTHRNTISLVRRLTSPALGTRLNVDLDQLAARLEKSLVLFDPRTAVAWLRDRAQPQEALQLLQELFPLTETLGIDAERQYDLLCLAGELCAKYLRCPLDAIDYYERAIDSTNVRPEAFQEQLRVIASSRHHATLETMLESNSTVATELDMKLWRNYRFLARDRMTHADNEDDEMNDRLVARYALWRGQYDIARDFIYPRLTDEDGTYIWWDFDLNLAYVRAFLGLENGDGTNLGLASQQLQRIKDGLEFFREHFSFDPSLAQQYGEEVGDLEYRIFRASPNLNQ